MADRLNYFIVGTVINYFQAVKFEKPGGFHGLYSTPFHYPCPCLHILQVMFSLGCQWKYTGSKPADRTRNNLVQKNLSPPTNHHHWKSLPPPKHPQTHQIWSKHHVIGDNEHM